MRRATCKTLLLVCFTVLLAGCTKPEPEPVTSLQIKDTRVGTGAEAVSGRTVRVHYTGTLLDGTEFDSSRPRGEPIEFRLGTGEVIAGWDEGIRGMRVGGRRELTIPSNMAYGSRGSGDVIPPNAALKFEVELVEVE
jgi:FKBP-type peptidyl-prolyl cis-trans isomerase